MGLCYIIFPVFCQPKFAGKLEVTIVLSLPHFGKTLDFKGFFLFRAVEKAVDNVDNSHGKVAHL